MFFLNVSIAIFCEWAGCDRASWVSHINVVAYIHKMGEKGWGGWAHPQLTCLESSNTAPPEAEPLASKHVRLDGEQARTDLTLVEWRVHQMAGRESYSFCLWSWVLFFFLIPQRNPFRKTPYSPPPSFTFLRSWWNRVWIRLEHNAIRMQPNPVTSNHGKRGKKTRGQNDTIAPWEKKVTKKHF